jgi:hypothetical protein
MRGALLIKRLAKKEQGIEPWIAALIPEDLERAISRAAEAYNSSRRSGTKRFLVMLVAEKNRRAARRR